MGYDDCLSGCRVCRFFQFIRASRLLQVDEKDRKLSKHPPVAGEITEMVLALTCHDG